MSILDKLTELSFLELRHGRIYTKLGGDVTDELVATVNAAAAEDAAAISDKIDHMLALINQMRQRGITSDELDELERVLAGAFDTHSQ